MTYDPTNVFAKILRGEIPNKTLYEDDKVLAFTNIHPQKKVHVMIIPKSAYTDISDFSGKANDDDILALMRAVPKIAEAAGISKSGFRLISNCGPDSGQEIPHFHFHLLGGEAVGKLVE